MSDNVVWIFKNVNKSLVEQQNEMFKNEKQVQKKPVEWL
ncbi:Uncharacterised protein [Legionella quinlivanii]|nr:Uncharacterised protein [Legionella quinlivanii]